MKMMKSIKPIYVNRELIAACGLYCGACRKFRKGRCAGCRLTEDNHLQWCKIRKCCHEQGYHTCAECGTAVEDCKTHNNLIGKLFALLFNSDRAACIHYIMQKGEDAYAEKMAWDEKMTMNKR